MGDEPYTVKVERNTGTDRWLLGTHSVTVHAFTGTYSRYVGSRYAWRLGGVRAAARQLVLLECSTECCPRRSPRQRSR